MTLVVAKAQIPLTLGTAGILVLPAFVGSFLRLEQNSFDVRSANPIHVGAGSRHCAVLSIRRLASAPASADGFPHAFA